MRRRLTARLQDPVSSLSWIGPDETVHLGAALALWRSPDRAAARREVDETPKKDRVRGAAFLLHVSGQGKTVNMTIWLC